MKKQMTIVENFPPGTPEETVQKVQQDWLENTLTVSSDYTGSESAGWVLTTVLNVVRSVMTSINRHKAI